MPLQAGTTFAGFAIVQLLGVGGMGEVYLVKHPRLPRQEALKLLSEELASDLGYRERFHREADLAATLWHPHLVGLHDRGETNGRLWISMDYIDGSDTAELLRSRFPGGLPRDDVVEIVSAIASALDYAHDRKMLHRDVKPANILRTDSGTELRRIALADFGVARELNEVSGLTATNLTVGTVAYAAPEQLMGLPLDGRADQYALAATAFHLLTGTQMFLSSNPVAVISQHLNADPPLLASHRPELADMNSAFATALAKDPNERFSTCAAFAKALESGSSGGSVSATMPTQAAVPLAAPPPTIPAPATSKSARRTGRWKPFAAAAAAAIVLAGVISWALPRVSTDHSTASASPTAAAPTAPSLDGAYQLNWAPQVNLNGSMVNSSGAPTTWWAFRSICRPDGCVATAVKLDDDTHQLPSTKSTEPKTLRFLQGVWRELPPASEAQRTLKTGCSHTIMTQWVLTPQSDGSYTGTQRQVVTTNECGFQGVTWELALTHANRTGDVPAGVPVNDPATVALPTAGGSNDPTLGEQCTDTDKVGFDPATDTWVVCTGAWTPTPPIAGVKTAGSACIPQPEQFMAISDDAYLINCSQVNGSSIAAWVRVH